MEICHAVFLRCGCEKLARIIHGGAGNIIAGEKTHSVVSPACTVKWAVRTPPGHWNRPAGTLPAHGGGRRPNNAGAQRQKDDENMSRESAYFIVRNLDGKHDLKELKQELDTLRGVSSVSVNTQNHLVSVDYDSSGVTYDRIEHRLNRLGYEIAADASNIQTQ